MLQGECLSTLGLLTELHPAACNKLRSKVVDIFKLVLHLLGKNFSAAKPDMPVIVGGIKCLTAVLNNFSDLVENADTRAVSDLYRCVAPCGQHRWAAGC